MKKLILIILSAMASVSFVTETLWASNSNLKLDSADGSSNFIVQDSALATKTQIDSSGNIVTTGCLRVDSGGAECTTAQNLIVDGNIGVGTSIPTTLLDLSSASSALRLTRVSNASTITSRNGMITYDSTENELQAYINGSWVDLNGATNGSFVLVAGDTMTGSLWFSTVGQDIRTPSSEHLVLAPGSGNVGIGRTAPRAVLELSGTTNTLIINSGNVGIGTTAPGALLELVSATPQILLSNVLTDSTNKLGSIAGRHYTNSEEPVTILNYAGSVVGGLVGFGGGFSDQNAASTLLFYTGSTGTTLTGTERMRITNTGNVGVGISAPLAILDISSTSSALRVTRLSNASTITSRNGMIAYDSTENELQAYINGSWVDLNGTTNGSFVLVAGDTMTGSLWFSGPSQDIRTPGSEHLVLAPGSGNVGIGTTSVSAVLEISSTTAGLLIDNASYTSVGVYPLQISGTFNPVAGFIFSNTGIVGNGAGGGSTCAFGCFGSYNIITLDYPGGTGVNGGVGVLGGVATKPRSFTTISGSALYAATPSVGLTSSITTTNGLKVANQGASGVTTAYGIYVDAQSGATNNYAAIFAGGNVGIGHTAPRALLQLSSTNSTTTALAVSRSFGNVGIGTTTVNALVELSSTISTAPALFVSQGNVGIGTSSPTAFLQIQDASTTAGVVDLVSFRRTGVSADADGIGLLFELPDGSLVNRQVGKISAYWVDALNTDSRMGFFINPTTSPNISEKMTLNQSGNLGIGTTVPEVLLEVQGAEATDASLLLDTDDGDDAADSWFIQSTASDNDLDFLNDTSTKVTFTSGGNVGIGTTTVNALLELSATSTTSIALTVTQGRVGIGTTNTLSTLQVEATHLTPDAIQLPGNNIGANLNVFSTNALAADKGGSIGLGGVNDDTGTKGPFGIITGRKDNATSTDLFGYLSFWTGVGGFGAMSERMRIASDGHVGIGTTAINAYVELSSTSATVPVLVTSRGNVGIGISAPAQALEVTGNIAATAFGLAVESQTAECLVNGCTATATCTAGKVVVFGMTAATSATCDTNPSSCTAYCTVGASTCAIAETGAGNTATVYAICAKVN